MKNHLYFVEIKLCAIRLFTLLQVDRQESAREQKRAEVLDSMKRLFPGVVSECVVMIFALTFVCTSKMLAYLLSTCQCACK